MKRKFTFLAALALLVFMAPSMVMWGQTTLNIGNYASTNNWTNGTQYLTATEDDVTFTATGGGNTGKYYSTDNSWRFYANENATLTISVPSGNTLVSVTPTFTIKDNGTLIYDGSTITSGSEVSVSGESVVFSISQSSGNKGKIFFTQIVVSYTTGGTQNPSITATDVEIEYNATSGNIAYTVNNPVSGGVLTASTTADWLTPGTVGDESVAFTCEENDGASDRSATVQLTYTYNTDQTVTKNVTVTQAGNPNVVDNISDITAAGTYTVRGTVVAKSTRGFVLGDGTGYIYYYKGSAVDQNVGDIVKISGAVSAPTNYKVFQYTNTATITTAESSNYQAEDPTVLTGSQMDAVVTGSTVTLSNYVQYVGTLTVSGNYYNITSIDGASTAKGSISYPTSTDFTSLDGEIVTVTGYYVGVSSNQYYNTMLGSIEEVVTNDPSITANNVEIEYNAIEGEIAYTINNPVSGGVMTAATTADWLTLDNDFTSPIAFDCSANTSTTPRTATVTLTYTYNTNQTVTKDVTVTQAGYETPHFTWDLSIDQTATATETEMTWTSDFATMAVVKANATTNTNNYYPGTPGQNYTSTRFYKNSELTITPVAGYAITSVVFEATTTGYATALQGSTWTNATASVNETTVTVTPTNGTIAMSAVIGGTCGFTGVTVYYVEDNTPTITANNVTITYDTDADEIEYEINNPVDGGSLVASTDSDWLEVGDEAYTSNAGTIEFTCSVNPTAAARSATVTLTYTYNRATVTKNVTVTQEANPNAIDNISDITEAGTYTVRGTVVATSTRGFVLGDGTGYIYYYKGSAVEQSVGDIVTISGEVSASTNYKVFQYTSGATITAAETSNYQAEDPTALTGAQMDAIVTGSTVILSNYVQYQGVLSISNNHYNITDIDGAVTAIGSIFYPTSTDFTSLDGKTVLVKGYYVGVSSNTYYNTMLGTIEEVEVPHEEYTVTVSNLVNVNTYLFDGDEMVLEGEGTANILDGNEVLISLDVAEGYVIESLMVDGNNVTSQIAEDHSYTFNMPTHNVTITATAVEVPVFTPATYTLASTVESGKQYIIVAQRDNEGEIEYYAMGEQRSNNRKGVLVNANGNTITVNSEEVYEFTISSLEEEDFYSIYDARTPGYLYAAASGSNHLKTETTLDENHNGEWEITIDQETNVASVSATNSSNRHVMQFNYNNGNPAIFSCYADATQTAVYLYVKDETPAGTPLFISGYNGSAFANGGYHLIATPVDGINPANVTNMTNGNFDLYMFDQSGDDEWVNYRQGNNQFAFTELVAGMGYLYAHDTDITLYFEGDLIEGDSYDVSLVLDTDSEFPGWNLVGNSFTVPASIGDRDYYEMHENGRDLIQTSGAIDPMQGIFVIAETDEEELTFSKTIATGGSKVVMNVTSDRSSLVDRATIRFGEGRQLRKIQLNPDNTKIYITEGNTDYAVVRSSDEAEIPVSFKTAENGTYTINFSTEEVEMEYMHLIDNMTGADVDLLATPSYTFEARTTDYASRFRLVFATTTGVSENSENNFAFYNGGNWVINNMGDATLQVVDMLGHILSSETINGNASISIDQVPGVYMIRLVSGNDVKVQKVIIK